MKVVNIIVAVLCAVGVSSLQLQREHDRIYDHAAAESTSASLEELDKVWDETLMSQKNERVKMDSALASKPLQASAQRKSDHAIDEPLCGYGKPVCECKAEAKLCIVNLEVDEIRTFTSYQKFPSGQGMFVRGVQGAVHYIGDDGIRRPLEQYSERFCGKYYAPGHCTEPQFVDGATYRMALAVNGQIPGPTFIVHDQQRIVINVHNNLTSEGISIHWHGVHQYSTPWMDGVGQVTQCHIGPASSFSYVYTASPSGTFWYHSHSGAQRTDGLYGALIVKEKKKRLEQIRCELSETHNVQRFEDHPDKHTISLLDWKKEASIDIFSQAGAGLGFYPDDPIGELPPNDKNAQYNFTESYDNAGAGAEPYFSGLINGKGRYIHVPYAKTRLSVFSVEKGKSYRFRLIGAQGQFAYKFSIDGHKLTVVNTDGYWTKPQKNVDYIIVHTGERYDFILDADAPFGNYWIRAETLEADLESKDLPPFDSLGHVAEAILQYTFSIEFPPPIPSTEYQSIKDRSKPPCCIKDGCRAVNCHFKAFHPSYNIECINVQDLQLLEKTPRREMPHAYPDISVPGTVHFFNFNFEGDSFTASVNGRNFVLPSFPPVTQNEEFQDQTTLCRLEGSCDPQELECMCTHVVDIPFKKTIQLVLTSVGITQRSHPIHLHGHTFHVVHVGYPEYSKDTGFIQNHSRDIECLDDCPNPDLCPCTQPWWRDNIPPLFSINRTTIRKDTVTVPAGGYVVINFISDNPGYWFLHCHIEAHQLDGMAVIINEAFEQQQYLGVPKTFNRCGNFNILDEIIDEYKSEMSVI